MSVKAILLDLDGTVYEGSRLIEGADDAVAHLRNLDLRVLFCTNNSSKPASDIAGKLRGMNIPCTEEDVVSSGVMAMEYVLANDLDKIYVSGTEGYRREFAKRGITLCKEEDADCLVISMDTKIGYEDLVKATRAALVARCIVVCNEDRLFPREDGLCPGCGAISSAILHCSGRKADVILGKPHTHMMRYISEKYGYLPNEMVVIGDSPESDIRMAEDYGSKSVLVGDPEEDVTAICGLKELCSWSRQDFDDL